MYIKLIEPLMGRRPMDTDLKLRMSPPLGLYTIAAMFRHEHKVTVENENIRPVSFEDSPDVVGITVTVNTMPRAIEIAKRYRDKGIIVIAGGIHITTAWKTIPEGLFDSLCIGAAENTWPEIVSDISEGKLKPIYRCTVPLKGEEIVSPAYDMVSSGDYLYCNILHTSRGCPFRCDFCYNSSAERTYIRRPHEDVIREIKASGKKHIMFIDDNFAGNPEWTRGLLKELRQLDIRWHCAASINIASDEELLDEMRDSGCMGIFIGFESINPQSIDSVHKIQNSHASYEKAVEAIHSRGIMINASFVFGLNSDTPATFKATLDWIVKNRIETVTSHILTPYPGTALYDRMKEDGIITDDDLSHYDTAHVVFSPKNMTAAQLYEGYLWIYKNIYSWKNIIRRMPKSRRQIPSYLLFNIFYRKYGRLTDWLCRKMTYRTIGQLSEKWARM